METDWRRVAAEVRARREALHLTQAEAAAKGGLSEPSWNVLENARGKRYKPRTLRGVTIALDWPADAIERLGRGEDASGFEPAPPRPSATASEALRQTELGVGAALLHELDRLRHRLDALEQRVEALAALPAAAEATIRRAVAEAEGAGPPGSEAWIAEYRRALAGGGPGAAAGEGRDPSGVVVAADTGQPSARPGRQVARPSPTEPPDE